MQDVASIHADLQECERRRSLVASMLQRHADEQQQQQQQRSVGTPTGRSTLDATAQSAYSGAFEGSRAGSSGGGGAHPLLAAAQARLARQAEDVHALYADACRARDRLVDGEAVRFRAETASACPATNCRAQSGGFSLPA